MDIFARIAAHAVCKADTLDEAVTAFVERHSVLQGWRFVIKTPRGNQPGHAVSKAFANGAEVIGFFDRAFVIDEETLRDMVDHKPFGIDYSISFDTQAASHLNSITENEFGEMDIPPTRDPDFQEAIKYLLEYGCNFDPMPYIQENFRQIHAGSGLHDIYRTLRAYAVLGAIDLEIFSVTGVIKVRRSTAELNSEAQTMLSSLIYDATLPGLKDVLAHGPSVMNAILLEMIRIKLSRDMKENKMVVLAEFMEKQLGAMFIRELVIANKYFLKDQPLRFFNKIQRNKDQDVVETLALVKNMAWDLTHLRMCEFAFGVGGRDGARYHFPAFLSFDRRLVELAKACPIRSCAISPFGYVVPFYEPDVTELFSEDPNESKRLAEPFYSIAANARRVGQDKKVDMPRLVAKLEAEVAELLKS